MEKTYEKISENEVMMTSVKEETKSYEELVLERERAVEFIAWADRECLEKKAPCQKRILEIDEAIGTGIKAKEVVEELEEIAP